MRFLTNTYDPSDVERAKMNLVLSYEEWIDPNGRERAWQRHLEYLSDKIIGEPKASETYTVEQLKEMRLVGVYSKNDH